MKSLLIVDAHAMAYRSYFSMQGVRMNHPRTGAPTGAVHTFLRMLFRALTDLQPQQVAVVWDAPGKSFRSKLYSDYKATRKPMPDDLRPQIEEVRRLLEMIGFPIFMIEGFEADDLIGTLSRRFESERRVAILSGDKDCYQLLSENVTMLRSTKGVSELESIDATWVRDELGLAVEQVIDYMAIVGDASDNIPGAKGIGAKGAAKLLAEFGSLDEIYNNIDKVNPKGVREKLINSRELVALSRDLATIRCDVEAMLKVDESEFALPDYHGTDSIALLEEEGYRQVVSVLRRTAETSEASHSTDENGNGKSKSAAATKADYQLIADLASLEKLVKKLSKVNRLAVDTETDSLQPMQARLVGVSLCAEPGHAWYIALPPSDSLFGSSGIEQGAGLSALKPLLEAEKPTKIGQNIKYDRLVLTRHGIRLGGITFDTMLASYLLDPSGRRHNLDDQALLELGHETIRYEEVAGSGRNKLSFDQIEPEAIRDYAAEDADITLQLANALEPKLRQAGLLKIHDEIDLPLSGVLATMEEHGVAIDKPYFAKLADDYRSRLTKIENEIHELAGYPFNINSTKELQILLFEKLGLPTQKKTKTGYSTDHSVLEELRHHHPIVEHLLEQRKISKLLSTYILALPELIHPETGRIHTSFQQSATATGRLSSSDPNLQNIPIREESGRAIRRGFIAAPGCELLALDYSQIELRIMAHYAEDPALIEAFANNLDIHARTAASLFGVDESSVSPDQRSKAKVVNFSIIYGVTEFGLAQSLGSGRAEAQGYIKRFFTAYPGVKSFMDQVCEQTRQRGYVTTLTGRRRYLPEIKSSHRFRREAAERAAINTPIQGTSADIIKMAMVAIQRRLEQEPLQSKMILQVHDELLFEIAPEELEKVTRIAHSEMENAMHLKVPLRVDYRSGKNWDEAH